MLLCCLIGDTANVAEYSELNITGIPLLAKLPADAVFVRYDRTDKPSKKTLSELENSRSVSFLKGLSAPLIRSHLTKTVPVEDIAKIFALICALEAICPLVAPLMFNSLYAETLSVFPGAFYLLSTSITMACVVMLGVVQYYRYKTVTPYNPLESDSVGTVSDAVEDSHQD